MPDTGMLAITGTAKALIETWIASSTGDLVDVAGHLYEGGGIPPIAEFPAIVIGADTETREHKRAAGTDSIGFGEKYRWFIAIMHTSGTLYTSYQKACRIWEELKPLIDRNNTLDGTVDDTNINGDIEYGSPMFGDRSGLTYVILVRLVSDIRWGGTR